MMHIIPAHHISKCDAKREREREHGIQTNCVKIMI